MPKKSKPISKKPSQRKPHSKNPITTKEGDPLIKNLCDFVTSINIVFSSKPIYTGGRIIAMEKFLYSTCNEEVNIYSF
jgi:hypothetical protein